MPPSLPVPSLPTNLKEPGSSNTTLFPLEDVSADEEQQPDQEEELTDEESSSEQEAVGEELPTNANPLKPAGSDIDQIIESRINDDLWLALIGDLPCLEATRACISSLQQAAVSKNPLLVEIDTRIEEINSKIEEAKAGNRKSIRLGVFTPAVQSLVQTHTVTENGQSRQSGGFIRNVLGLFSNPVGTIDKVLSAIGIPLLQASFGGNEENQRNAIAISDLQIKVAELQRGRAELAQKIREEVYLAAFEYDEAAREFQISQEVAKRDKSRVQLLEVEYRLGEGDSNTYLNTLNSSDAKKAQTYRSWSAMRSRIEKIKLLVLAVEE